MACPLPLPTALRALVALALVSILSWCTASALPPSASSAATDIVIALVPTPSAMPTVNGDPAIGTSDLQRLKLLVDSVDREYNQNGASSGTSSDSSADAGDNADTSAIETPVARIAVVALMPVRD